MMSGLTAQATILNVEVYDAQEQPSGKFVDVWIDYVVNVDLADGASLVEYAIIDSYILPEALKQLTAEEAARSIQEAEAVFEQTEKHW